MPKKVLPDAEAFARFGAQLQSLGFRRLLPGEFRSDRMRLGLKAPMQHDGSEVGFTLYANGLRVIVWTTFIAELGRARDSDAGWVLIKEGDKRKYCSRPLHRTKNFLRNLLGHATVARSRVMHRPLCPKCHQWMDIARGKGLKARYWRCTRTPGKPEYLSWDYGLSQTDLDFLRPYRKRHAKYRAKLRKEGKVHGAALRSRRGWKVGRPENIVSM